MGWRSEYDRKLSFETSGSTVTAVDMVTADGNPLHFVPSGSNWILAYWDFSTAAWSSPRNDCYYSLTTDGTNWYLKNNTDSVDQYDSSGVLQTISYRGGYVQTLTYDGSGNNTVVSDSLGRSITFAYSASGLVTSLTDPDGNITQFQYVDKSSSSTTNPLTYQTLAVLQSVIFPATSGTPTLTYLYEDTAYPNQTALTGITDENGHRYATWSYDSTTGRVLSQTLAGGADQVTLSYDDTHSTVTVTNALGKQFIYGTNAFQGVLQVASIAGQASTHTAAATTSYLYDSNGYVSQITDGNGNVNRYVHNSTGQETSRTEGYGSSVARTITTTWDSTWREPDQIVEPNVTTGFTYDTSGRLSQLKQTDTTTQSIPYSTNGQTRTWTFTYYTTTGLVGLLDTVSGPLSGETTTYAYNSSGFVNSITDPLGHVNHITSINGRGLPLTSVDPNGVTTNYTYNPRGWILSVTVNPGAAQSQTSLTYDLAGNITLVTLPDGATLTYAYDNAHRLTSITNNLGESITYTLNALGDRTSRVIKSSTGMITKQQTATFDELGRVMANIGAASQTTTHAYDFDNNEITTTDPRSKVYGHAFDALNRLYRQTDPDLDTTTTAYDAQNRPISVTDARSLVTTYVRDGFGDAIQQASPDTGTTVFWYDGNGAVTKQVDARSIETDYTNDLTGRVLTKTFPADSAENVTYTYDSTAGGNLGIGRLTSVADQSGSTSFVYDPLGRIITDRRVIGSNSYSTAYTYDASGNILTETYPSGRIVTYTRDALGRISGVTTKQNSGATAYTVATNVTYEPFGPLAGLTFGNSLVATHTYDQDYELTAISAAGGGVTVQNLTNTYDPASNITAITDGVVPRLSQTFTYDDLNRLASASGVYGSQSYTYDGAGNRSTQVVNGTTATYAYSPTANKITTITAGANTRTFSYVPTGQVSGDVRDASHDYTFVANDNGRNASVALNGSTTGAYRYNAFEQRVQKIVGATTTQFVFDRFGHLLAEANATGVTQKEHLWLDGMPVGLVIVTGGSPTIYFIQTDQLGAPQKITNASAAIVWHGAFDPFGNPIYAVGGGIWGTSVWNSFSWGGSGGGVWGTSVWGTFPWGFGADLSLSNLRFPGQYADAETALNQNWFRDYDPTIGRYIQSDPIGVAAGPNTYAYASGNPLINSDPMGQNVTLTCRPVSWFKFLGSDAPKHCAVFVWHMSKDCPPKLVIDRQFSLPGFTQSPTQNTNNDTYISDLNAFNNPGGANANYDIPLPSRMSQEQLDTSTIQSGTNYSLPAPYSLLGPNSNTAATQIIIQAGGTVPDVPLAPGQFWAPPTVLVDRV